MLSLLEFQGAQPFLLQADFEFFKQGHCRLRFSWEPHADFIKRPQKNIILEDLQTLEKLRRDELWQSTCFELFLRETEQSRYIEINVSPEGYWNIYEFDAYRSPQPPKTHLQAKMNKIKVLPNSLEAEFEAPFLPNTLYEGSLTAVIALNENEKVYLAHTHSGEKPDFHHLQSFTILRKTP